MKKKASKPSKEADSLHALDGRAAGTKTVKLEWWMVEWHSDLTGWHPINLRHPTRKRAESALKRIARLNAYRDSALRLVVVEVVERTTAFKEVKARSPIYRGEAQPPAKKL